MITYLLLFSNVNETEIVAQHASVIVAPFKHPIKDHIKKIKVEIRIKCLVDF